MPALAFKLCDQGQHFIALFSVSSSQKAKGDMIAAVPATKGYFD